MSNTLLAGDKFDDTQCLISNNNTYKLNFDTGGTLILWDQTTAPMTKIWATPTSGKAPNGYAILQSDGNLVVYNSANQPVWNTELAGALQTKGVSLVLEDTGKIVAYGVTPIFDSVTWSAANPVGPGGASGSGLNIKQIQKIVTDVEEVISAAFSLFG